MDWSALSVLAAVVLGAMGYLSRQFTRELARAERSIGARIDRVDHRLDRLEEQYIRHLEAHAAPH